jgi:hypothetical protein
MTDFQVACLFYLSRPIEITAIIQRPSAYISPVEIDITESYVNVPITRHVQIHAINALPTHFRWGEVRENSSKHEIERSFICAGCLC